MGLRQLIKPIVPHAIVVWVQTWLEHKKRHKRIIASLKPPIKRTCSICSFNGYFEHWPGPPIIYEMLCPKCQSHTRHCLFWLWFAGKKELLKEPILHFAPEGLFEKKFRSLYAHYKTADLYANADLKLNIESIELDDNSIATVICNHVLEHVHNDKKALAELYRILSPNGCLIISVPIIEGWEKTYENPEIEDLTLRMLHFGQGDHVRYYGRDFRDRLKQSGFATIKEITAENPDVLNYGLMAGEKIFFCQKNLDITCNEYRKM